eukprot:m.3567 g.3567  ORF g.3567 m.3567 type:complete len:54 (-) comp2088_c0_seq1:190-351(-)
MTSGVVNWVLGGAMGAAFGIYVAQNYDIPRVSTLIEETYAKLMDESAKYKNDK